MKRKDALTDLVEHAEDAKPSEPITSPSGDRQVVNEQGETITLGYDRSKKVRFFNKGKSLELSIEEIERDIVRPIVGKTFEGFAEKVVQKVLEKLRDKL